MYYSTHYESPFGDIVIASDENNIIGLWIDNQKYIDNTMPKNMQKKIIIQLSNNVKNG